QAHELETDQRAASLLFSVYPVYIKDPAMCCGSIHSLQAVVQPCTQKRRRSQSLSPLHSTDGENRFLVCYCSCSLICAQHFCQLGLLPLAAEKEKHTTATQLPHPIEER